MYTLEYERCADLESVQGRFLLQELIFATAGFFVPQFEGTVGKNGVVRGEKGRMLRMFPLAQSGIGRPLNTAFKRGRFWAFVSHVKERRVVSVEIVATVVKDVRSELKKN